MTWSDEDLARMLKQGNVTILGDEADTFLPKGTVPIIIGSEPKGERVMPAKKAGIPVPKEHCLKHGAVFASKTEAYSMPYLLETYQPLSLLYEPVMFRLPSGSYTPDWAMTIADNYYDPDWEEVVRNKRIFYEVKGAGGFKAYQSGRSSRKSLVEAAYHLSEWGEFRLLVKVKGGGWHEETV